MHAWLYSLAHYEKALPDLKRVCQLQPNNRGARTKLKEVQTLVKKLAFEKAIAFEQVTQSRQEFSRLPPLPVALQHSCCRCSYALLFVVDSALFLKVCRSQQ